MCIAHDSPKFMKGVGEIDLTNEPPGLAVGFAAGLVEVFDFKAPEELPQESRTAAGGSGRFWSWMVMDSCQTGRGDPGMSVGSSRRVREVGGVEIPQRMESKGSSPNGPA